MTCAVCGELPAKRNKAAKQRQRRVLQAVFQPDIVNEQISTREQERPQKYHQPTKKKAVSKSEQPVKMKTQAKQDVDMGKSDEEELTRKDVPDYDDATYETDRSLKDLLAVMRKKFRVVGKNVDAFENTLTNKKTNVAQLPGLIDTAAVEQKAHREEARATAENMKEELKEFQTAQKDSEERQVEALKQLHQQVLKEMDDPKERIDRQEQAHPQREDMNEEGEWVRRENMKPRTTEPQRRESKTPRNIQT